MVKNVLLGLLSKGPKHGYELKGDFEELLGGTWTLNIGQVYLTLGRLERDGLVSSDVVAQETRPDRKVYSLAELGRKELERWASEPVRDPVHLRDELLLKVLVQGLLRSDDPRAFVWEQRQHHMELLAELVSLRDEQDQARSAALILEAGIAHIEADLKWLDIVEGMLAEGGAENDGRA